MILYLDSVAPIPKFVLSDNNKNIESLDILDKKCSKVSDIIHKKYVYLQKKYNLTELLDKLVVCNGPGSYTGIRVCISFMLGLSYSLKLPINSVSYPELLIKFIKSEDFYKTLIIICSSNNQNFLCIPINLKTNKYKIFNVNEKNLISNFNSKFYDNCISNAVLPGFLKDKKNNIFKKIKYINFEKSISKDLKYNLLKNNILQPIYISDNKLFD
tara:strand:+ start:3246 stop:3887 length:642 start_codon:yes stop_codon:yes gene_type:complete